MALPYWIVDDKLIFKPEFNEELDNYYDVISQYNTLIFSNYNYPLIAIKTNNKYNHEYRNNYKYSNFNKKIELDENITHLSLSFGFGFNQPLKLTSNITNFSFTFSFI